MRNVVTESLADIAPHDDEVTPLRGSGMNNFNKVTIAKIALGRLALYQDQLEQVFQALFPRNSFSGTAQDKQRIMRVLAMYNHSEEKYGIPRIDNAGMIDMERALDASSFGDDQRIAYAFQMLQQYAGIDSLTPVQTDIILEAHHNYAHKDFLMLSTEEKNNIRNILSKDPLFRDTKVQDILMYHVICGGAFKWFVFALLLVAAVGGYGYWNGRFDPKSGPAVVPPPHLPMPQSPEEARYMLLNPQDIAKSILNQSPDFTVVSDTIESHLPWAAKFDPEKNQQWGYVFGFKRWVESRSWMGSQDYVFTSPYIGFLGFSKSDLAARSYEGKIDTRNPESVIKVKGLKWSDVKRLVFNSKQRVKRTDSWSREDSEEIRWCAYEAMDSMQLMTGQYMVPASAFMNWVAEQNATMEAQKAISALFGQLTAIAPELINHTITFEVEVEYTFPTFRKTWFDGPHFSAIAWLDQFHAIAPEGTKKIVTVVVTKPSGQKEYTATVKGSVILPAPIKPVADAAPVKG